MRNVVKWSALVACLVLSVAWTISGWWGITRIDKRGDLWVLRAGKIFISHRSTATPRAKATVMTRRAPHAAWEWYADWYSEKGSWMLVVPLWPVFTLIVVPTAMVFRRDISAARRSRATRCRRCGYDLRGLGLGAVCPECGNAPPEAAA